MSETPKEPLKLDIAMVRAVLDGVAGSILVGDRNGILVDVNRRACEMLGYAHDELVGQPASIVHVPSELPLLEQSYALGLRGEPYSIHYTFLSKDGREIPVELRCTLIEAAGEPLLVALVLDSTEREAMLRDIVKKERALAVSTIAEGVAHEFNNLLARILACAEEGSEHALDLTVRKDLSRIIEASEEAGRIAEKLLAYARRRPLEKSLVSLTAIIEHALQIMEDDLAATKIAVLRDFEPLPAMMLDSGQIGQVFMNLIANARDAMPGGGALHVSARRVGGEAVVYVTDTGPGIPPEILADLFKPFVTTKGARAHSSVPGMGLGLSACDGIIASHGGSIAVDSVVGRGTTFVIRLPLPDDATKEKAGP